MPEWLGNGLAGGQIERAALLFAIAAVAANLLRLAQLRWNEAYIAMVTHELTLDVQRHLLAQPFCYHAVHHSSEALAALDQGDDGGDAANPAMTARDRRHCDGPVGRGLAD